MRAHGIGAKFRSSRSLGDGLHGRDFQQGFRDVVPEPQGFLKGGSRERGHMYGDVSLVQLRQEGLAQKEQSANPECNKQSNRCDH